MGKIIEAGELPYDEKVYLKKDFLGWRTVEPWKLPNGKIKWFNFFFGGKRSLYFVFTCLFIVFLLYMGINELIGNYKAIAESPCDFCVSCHEQTSKVLGQLPIKDFQTQELNLTFDGAENG